MVNRSKISEASNLICLLVISYITMGMPLIHPVLHDHMAHDNGIEERNVNPPHADIEKNEDCNCPICNFLATSQFHYNASFLSAAGKDRIAIVIPRGDGILVKTISDLDQPRAPPLFS